MKEPNSIIYIDNDIVRFSTTNNQGEITAIVTVDRADWKRVSTRRWYKHHNYIVTITSKAQGKKRRYILLHNYITKREPGNTDHENNNPLDNRRANLRRASVEENSRNRSKVKLWKGKPPTSQYKGVSRRSDKYRTKIYQARIFHKGKCIWLGCFETEEQAGLAYNEAALKYHKEFAKLNEI